LHEIGKRLGIRGKTCKETEKPTRRVPGGKGNQGVIFSIPSCYRENRIVTSKPCEFRRKSCRIRRGKCSGSTVLGKEVKKNHPISRLGHGRRLPGKDLWGEGKSMY